MDKFTLAKKIKQASPQDKVLFIQEKCSGKRVLDLGCIRHSASFAEKDENWLHKKIKQVASYVLGVDYLEEDVKELKKKGYNVVYGDVTKPLVIDEKFDVIIAGDLIEHINNFEGFFCNCRKLLKDNGEIIVTTPNPFYTNEFHYVAFKKNYLMNPEHTCWIDPYAMGLLASRFGFVVDQAFFIKDSWKLGDLMFESENYQYDILHDTWKGNTSRIKTVARLIIGRAFNTLYGPYKFLSGKNSKLVKYSDYGVVLKVKD